MQTADSVAFATLSPKGDKEAIPQGYDGEEKSVKPRRWGESLYPRLLRELVETVLKHESFLFSPEELALLKQLQELSYEPRYLLVRLALRTRSKLHRLSDLELKYNSEIQPPSSIANCIDKLCVPISHNNHALPGTSDAPIDIGLDDDDPIAGPSPKVDKNAPVFRSFAEDESSCTTSELLNSLKVDELKRLATDMKVHKTGLKREELTKAILASAGTQTTLRPDMFPVLARPSPRNPPSTPPRHSNGKHDPPEVINLVSPDPPKKAPQKTPARQTTRLRHMIMKIEPKFIRVSEDVFGLLQRLNLVYFRSTSFASNTMLLPLILARTGKRNYPFFDAIRTSEVFASRDHLLLYEDALRTENDVEQAPEDATATRTEKANKTYEICSTVYPKWKQLVAEVIERGEEGFRNRPGLERFEEGHVLTRVIYKAADALGQLKRYKEEVTLLEELLSQRRWRKGKRGEWYERLALILMTHLDEHRRAMQVVIDGLNDHFTHVVYRPRLVRRLMRLEKRLKLPENERHTCEGSLKKMYGRMVFAKRVPPREQSNTPAKPLFSGENIAKFSASKSPFLGPALASDEGETTAKHRAGHHSIWVGRSGAEIGVEEVALEHYENLGYRGFHSEGRILYHIFLLLFWSVIYMPVPGAFETSYQIAPLDLGHDSFYHTREDAIEKRLQEIEEGQGLRILEEVDDRERPRDTFAVGSRWELFSKEDTMEIVKCIGSKALAVICRVICEDYAQRSSGVPDLILWHPQEQRALFAEVKGPGDTLMENQKVWIDVLLGAGVPVEVCLVREHGTGEKKDGGKKSTKRKRRTTTELEPESESDDDRLDNKIDGEGSESTVANGTRSKKASSIRPVNKRVRTEPLPDAATQDDTTGPSIRSRTTVPRSVPPPD